jgi:hypothetical protein
MRLLAMLLCLLPLTSLAVETLRYPRPESDGDKRADYPVKMLALVLRKAGGQYRLQPTPVIMPQSRALLELQGSSRFVHVAWTMSSKEREAQALPVRIPIDQGLFREVKEVRDLAGFASGLGHDWPDTAIMRANGLSVIESHNYELLFRMLSNRQVAYFPRSLNEIWEELDSRPDSGFAVADHIVLHYVAPLYFFVNKDDHKLAAVIERGLEKAIADGSYEQLFRRYYGQQIRRAKLDQRRVLEMNNPTLPAETPVGRAALWFKPQK